MMGEVFTVRTLDIRCGFICRWRGLAAAVSAELMRSEKRDEREVREKCVNSVENRKIIYKN